jgi:plasmid replication initiation protein
MASGVLTAKPLSQTAIADRHVTMANHIMRASHGLTLPEKRMIAAAMAKSDTTDGRALTDERFWTVKLSAAEYAETFDVTSDTAYEQLQAGADGLLSKLIEEPKKGPRGAVRVVKHQWLLRAEYVKGEGSVSVTWHPDLRPFVFCLRREFTTYKLKHAAALRSIYSWRLFECLKSWDGAGKWSPTIEEFWSAMDAKPAHRANFKALRQRIIEPAVAELRAKNGLLIDWQPVKEGRRVGALRFEFVRNPQAALF